MLLRLVVAESGVVIAERLGRATSVRQRMRGLLGNPTFGSGEGLLLSPCKQVHTFGMRYPIDVVFCDRDWRVRHIVRGMRPGRVSRVAWKARHTIELRAGAATDVRIGDQLLIQGVGL